MQVSLEIVESPLVFCGNLFLMFILGEFQDDLINLSNLIYL